MIPGERSSTTYWRSAEPFGILSWSWNVSGNFWEKTIWRSAATDGFGNMGYHCHVRQEQAARYLPQYRSRGIMIVTRDDMFTKAMSMGIGELYTAEVEGTNPTILSSRL
eukprot:13736989-Heterocapsa_arctica.AAC.1